MTQPSRERASVPLVHRPVTVHAWQDVVFAHWRHDPASLAHMVPRGTRPDVVDGSAWAGLTTYVFRETRVPPFPPSGRLGSMTEVTIEILTVDDHGRRGVVYRTVDTANVPAIVAAHALLGVPYTFAHARGRRRGDSLRYRSVRHPERSGSPLGRFRSLRDARSRGLRSGGPGQPRHAASIRVVAGEVDDAPLATELTTRAGIHARHLAQTVFWQRQHPPLTLRRATLERLDGDLPDAVGMSGLFDRAPDSLLVLDGTTVRYAWGDVVR
ncbi:YqjF family protein [Microbacterium sp. M1A1_1b]